jgi:DNA-binding transcriptional ArsR family regulator
MTKLHLSRERADEAVERIKIYAQPQRLMILSALLAGERTVGEIEAAARVAQPALSQQLAELRRAQLVETRRAAKQIYYRLANDNVALCIRCIEAMVDEDSDLAAALAEILALPQDTPRGAFDGAGAAFFAKLI